MSYRPIQVGDLVVVVRGAPCCGGWDNNCGLGTVFVVKAFIPHTGRCRFCGDEHTFPAADSDLPHVAYVARLKRIPPLEEMEGKRTEENLKEPA